MMMMMMMIRSFVHAGGRREARGEDSSGGVVSERRQGSGGRRRALAPRVHPAVPRHQGPPGRAVHARGHHRRQPAAHGQTLTQQPVV